MKKEKNIVVKLLMLLWYALTHPLVWVGRKLVGFFSRLNYRQIGKRIVVATGNFFHWLLFSVLIPKKYRNITKKEIYRIIFKADTPAGKRFDVWLLVLIGLNLLVIMLDSFEAVHSNLRWVLKAIEWLLTIIFTLEYYLRIYCLSKPWKYVFSFYGIIDFLSIMPAYLSLLIPATQTLTVLRVLRTLRIFRIFNMQRFLQESFHLLNAIRRSVTKILIFMLFVFIAAIILGSIIYMFENGKNPAMSSIPKAIYWAVVTITTVGYGDITPVTPMGQFISTLVMLLGYSIIAVPTGIVVGETIQEHKSAENGERRTENGERRTEGGEAEMAVVPDEFNEYEESRMADTKSMDTGSEVGPRFCTHCGHTEEDPDARYCRYCGTLLSKSQPSGWINDFFKS
ncbi:MAG: ion transporter [Bacteroidales bacterium]|nr:ion transporter [Bacteroidales bacterium]